MTADYVAIDWASWVPKQDDEAESEQALRDWMYAYVRLLRPALVVETGAYKGAMTETLGCAVLDNHFGRVVSCEPNLEFAREATARCALLPVTIYEVPSAHINGIIGEADFLFLDSDYSYRRDEMRNAKKGAVIVIHDAYKSYDPTIEPLAPLIEQMGGIAFRCGIEGRGFGILVKR